MSLWVSLPYSETIDGIFKDNEIIFDITETDKKIPLHNLKETLLKRLKLNNASDIQFLFTC